MQGLKKVSKDTRWFISTPLDPWPKRIAQKKTPGKGRSQKWHDKKLIKRVCPSLTYCCTHTHVQVRRHVRVWDLLALGRACTHVYKRTHSPRLCA